MRSLQKIITRITSWSSWAVSFLIIPLALVVVYTVIMRYFFAKAPVWGFEVPIFLYGIFFMVAGAEGLRLKVHVTVDVFPRMLSLKGKQFLEIFSTIIIIIVCLTLTWHGYNMAWDSTLINEHSTHQSTFNPPIWWFKWFIPLSAALILLQALNELIISINNFMGKERKNNA
ncbi:TRAP transporter small permease subunit [Bacillus sp. DTU_2020_1000418_1_SI_GHA_SEK_038]|uniref:TRAP transporter small permease subunit n=1 Tax=Bacillus sp. DTU_2020_1000418_1_SI_GHA_SEK_038 TaxID=3077585 RepID=UPI0028E465FC|nr:TRAP transporter small permease subunit [Bacillus sp. DTU_2020_1000418_1_SI_GHA_SEK_038]WNS75745.1 TRAP transporter small permease subunit [Bacillus sp. DTU_2020_1000418_1_SI_GHA_SEK_038]